MNEILISILVLSIMGGLFGLVLAIASKIFFVKTDERLEPLTEALPGANCGGCGYSGCGGYAQAVLEGKAPIGLCSSGGNESAQKMAAIMGQTAANVEPKRALVKCRRQGDYSKGAYEGIHDCIAAAKVAGNGPGVCKFGCLGFGTCTTACKYDAIHVVNGLARVDSDKCVGCMQCAKVCPRGIIAESHMSDDIVVACSSRAKGKFVMHGCDVGCIACGKCQKVCPKGAITVTNNLATIDYSLCDSCGLCAEVCPRHLIADTNLRHDQDLATPHAR